MRIKILLLLSVILLGNCTPQKERDTSLFLFVPKNAAVIIKINDFESFKNEINENEIISKLKQSVPAKKISNTLKPLKYLNNQSEGLLTFSAQEDTGFDFIYVSMDTVRLINLDSIANKTIESLMFKTFELKKYQIEGNIFYTSIINQREVIGSSQSILEDLLKDIDEKEGNPRVSNKFFQASNSTKLGHIWINLETSSALFQNLSETDNSINASNFADWLSLDLALEDEELVLSGIAIAQDSLKNYLELFSKTKALTNYTTSLAPGNTDAFKSYTFNNYGTFSKNQVSYLKKSSPIDSLLNTVEEIGIAQADKQEIIFLKTFGTASIIDYLKSIERNSIEFQGGEILELGQTTFINDCLEPIITDFDANYVSIIENTFIFSQSLEALQNTITSFKSGNVFEKTMLFKNGEEVTTKESTVLSLANTTGFQTILKNNNLIKLAQEVEDSKLNDYLFGSQIIADDDFLHTSYFIKKISNTNDKNTVTSLFNVELDADITSNPQFVTNHNTKRQEIVVQDQDNILYLISTKGKVLWKKQLNGAIQGKIHQVDIYKNGKLQLAFTTNNEFIILDRNGKEVPPFTKSYEGGNLNPLSVFDYEGNKNYRFVVTQNEKIFMYNSKGEIVSGFKYKKAEDSVLEAPQHFRIGQKDYLVFKLSNGNLKILNRVGDVRVKVNEKIPFSENDIKVYKNQITLTTDKGILYQINVNGKIQKTDLNLNADHGMDASSKTLAIMNDNILRIRDKKVALDLGVYSKPTIFYLNDKIYVSVTDIQSQKTYLFDSQAEPIPNFPLFGSSTIDMADMDNDKKPELVIKDQENSIVVYKIR